jgi:hypothetical protein
MQKPGELETETVFRLWCASVAAEGELRLVTYERPDHQFMWLLEVKSLADEWVGLEAAVLDGDGHLWIQTGFLQSEQTGSPGGEQAGGPADLDSRSTSTTLTTVLADEQTARTAERRASFCPECSQDCLDFVSYPDGEVRVTCTYCGYVEWRSPQGGKPTKRPSLRKISFGE